ncbi:SUN domain-containing protein 5 isoform X4 [Zalophus californianus]|uniref:SUN domain-containing protein 5 isoform X4 n=1 Tax=Zalophus californianus TaxID=9704 RepID=A0A6J2FFS7_ZALCA|nr:SUN domain-containing protein 5 isoform X4 [Zalophus californianus]
MPRSSRSPGDLCDPPEDVRPRRGPKRWMAPEHVNAACLQCPLRPRLASRSRNACRITEDTLSNTNASSSSRSSWKRQVFWSSVLLDSGCFLCTYHPKWKSGRMYQEKVRHHTGEIQDLRGNMTQLIAKLQLMEAMSDEEKLAQKIMKMIQGDFIEKPDFALKSIGASIDFEQTSATYNHDKARSYWNWIRLWNYAQPPDVILEPNMTPGNCWAFSGDRGQVTIRLAQKVYLSNLTLQHIPKTISLSGSLDTAPKDFVIYGMEGSPREEVFLGAFQFQPENIIQMFQLQNQLARAFGAVKVKISSNWGNPRFTCLYRVRVHGSVTPPRMP